MLEAKALLNIIVTEYKKILRDNLVGIYLHGSLAMECYNSKKSDIDFLVVINEKINLISMRALIDVLIRYSSECPQKGFEMSIILREDAERFIYPTPFILHYSDFHRERYIKDSEYVCGGFNDPDLAAHIMIIRERGKNLYGESIDSVFAPVPKKYYIDSIINDVKDAKVELVSNPTYYILNLCRVVYYLKEEIVSSKKEAGLWGYNNLSNEYSEIIELALDDYSSKSRISDWKEEKLKSFAEYMANQINIYMCNID